MNKHYELIANHIQESLDDALDITIAEMQEDNYYVGHQNTVKESIQNNDIHELLAAQMTIHNMELEAVYRAGHRDCIIYLSQIGALKNE